MSIDKSNDTDLFRTCESQISSAGNKIIRQQWGCDAELIACSEPYEHMDDFLNAEDRCWQW
jgi:hypothetical protein